MADREFPLDLLHALGDVGIDDPVMPVRGSAALEREMDGASKRAHGRARVVARRPGLAWLAPVVSIAVAAAVAVLVIVLLSPRSPGVEPGPAAARSVSERFAVLRRPPTARDRLPLSLQRQVAVQDGGRVLPGLTRLIATRGPGRVLLVVLVTRNLGQGSSLAWSPRLGDQVALVAVKSRPVADLAGSSGKRDRPSSRPGFCRH